MLLQRAADFFVQLCRTEEDRLRFAPEETDRTEGHHSMHESHSFDTATPVDT